MTVGSSLARWRLCGCTALTHTCTHACTHTQKHSLSHKFGKRANPRTASSSSAAEGSNQPNKNRLRDTNTCHVELCVRASETLGSKSLLTARRSPVSSHFVPVKTKLGGNASNFSKSASLDTSKYHAQNSDVQSVCA